MRTDEPTRRPKTASELLQEQFGAAAVFAAASTTIGLVSGATVGFVTAVMTNRMDTPIARPHIFKATRLLGLAGLVHGVVGAGVMMTRGKDDYYNRIVSGCAAGASLGIMRTV